MSYNCKACSYRGNASGRDGACPACGSFNVSKSRTAALEQPAVSSKWRLTLLIGLWATLLVMVLWKLAQTQ